MRAQRGWPPIIDWNIGVEYIYRSIPKNDLVYFANSLEEDIW